MRDDLVEGATVGRIPGHVVDVLVGQAGLLDHVFVEVDRSACPVQRNAVLLAVGVLPRVDTDIELPEVVVRLFDQVIERHDLLLARVDAELGNAVLERVWCSASDEARGEFREVVVDVVLRNLHGDVRVGFLKSGEAQLVCRGLLVIPGPPVHGGLPARCVAACRARGQSCDREAGKSNAGNDAELFHEFLTLVSMTPLSAS